MGELLEVRDLKTYFFTRQGVVRAVDGISYAIAEGRTLGIVGESGCGKSVGALSLLQLVPNPPGKIVGGSIIFGERDLVQLSDQEMDKIRGREIAMIFQDPMTSLNPVMTVHTQLTEHLRYHLKVGKREAREKAVHLLESVGIPDPERRLSEYPHQLSGGLRQRVMIAGALACEPRLLIADEPTTALDVTIQAQILELLKTLQQRSRMALILITHDLGVVAGVTDEVIVMYAGRIVEKAETKEIFRRPSHPYTVALLASVPRIDNEDTEYLANIPGAPPLLIDPEPGCRFASRCAFASGCPDDPPPLLPLPDAPAHYVACWKPTTSWIGS